MQILGPYITDSDSVNLGWGPGICILNDISINLFPLNQINNDLSSRNNLTSSFSSNTCVKMSFISIT